MGELQRERRLAVRASWGSRCAYCGVKTGSFGTIDHYMPRALGGTNERENLRWACRPCNERKADMPPELWERVRGPTVAPPAGRAEVRRELLMLVAARGRWAYDYA